MIRFPIPMVAAMGLLSGPASAAPEKPSGPWEVVYEDARCYASRGYGEKPAQKALMLKPSPSGGVMRIYFVEPGKGGPEQRPGRLKLGSETQLAVSALTYGERQSGQLVAAVNLPMAQFKARRDARFIALTSSKVSHELATPGLAKVVAALEDCQANLQDIWNIAPAKARLVTTPAVSERSLQRYFLPSDYPTIALRRGEGGIVVLNLLIDETGKIVECGTENTSGIASLDANSCAIITTRAKFAPARDQSGKPIKSHLVVPIWWKMES